MPSNVPPHLLRSLNPEDAMQAFTESVEEAAEAAQRSARATGDDTRERRKATKAFTKQLRTALNSAPAGVLAQATQAGVRSQFNSDNTFGQGFTASVSRLASGASGVAEAQIGAVDRAAGRTLAFFTPAAQAGIDFNSPEARAQVDRINDFFLKQENNTIPLQRQVTTLRTNQTNQAFAKEAFDQMIRLQQDAVDALRELSGKFGR